MLPGGTTFVRGVGSVTGFKSGSPDPGDTVDGVPIVVPEGYDGTAEAPPTVEGAAYSTAPSEAALGPQQVPLPRLKTRFETRPKNPHGLKSPLPLPQFASGPD